VAKQQQAMPKRYLLDLAAAAIPNFPSETGRTLTGDLFRRYRPADIAPP
jgi:hypothetical protein